MPRDPLNVRIGGDLLRRLTANYDRLERHEYEPAAVYAQTENNRQWPGDTPGRTILALAHLAHRTGRQPRYLDEIVRQLDVHLNPRGYMGQDWDGPLDEQQLSGHGWLVSGLLEYATLTGNAKAADVATRVVQNLFLQCRGRMHSYPVRPDDRKADGSYSGTRAGSTRGWNLSTDIGCAFIMLEGLVPWYESHRADDARALIDEVFEVFSTIDWVGDRLQLHATLTAVRSFLRYHDTHPRQETVDLAQRVYGLFREQAMTANYANYNWFGRPETWTEPCAIVDALIVAYELWRKTGITQYLEDAHHIYFNGLGYAQKPHGGFGCDNCCRPDEPVLFNKVYDVTWCCNMRGAVGLSHAVHMSTVYEDGVLTLPISFDCTIEAAGIRVRQKTRYPHQPGTELVVEQWPKGTILRWFVPSWTQSPQVVINERATVARVSDGFALVQGLRSGDTLVLDCQTADRDERTGDHYTRHRGPLVLASSETGGESTPLNDVIDRPAAQAKTDRRRVLVPR